MKTEHILTKIKRNLIMRKFYGKILYCCLLVVLLSFNTEAFANQTKLEPGSWIDVNITDELKGHLSELPKDEQYEQMRDWIILAFMTYLELDEDKVFDALYDFTPMRYDFLGSLASYRYGESRYINLKSGELYIFLPYQSPKSNVYIGRICDEYRLIYGKKPIKAAIIEYQLSISNEPKAKFVFTKDIDQQTLFSEQMGYRQETIYDKAELVSFLSKIDDIVYVNNPKSEGIILGGRRFENHRTRSVNLEDLAVLYQADSNLKEDFRKKLEERGFEEEYENNIKMIVDSYFQDNPEDKSTQSRKSKEDFFRTLFPYEEFNQAQIEGYLKSVELNIGFSLDPQVNHKAFAEVLKKMLSKDSDFAVDWFNKNLKEQTEKAIELERKAEKEQALPMTKNSNELFDESGETSLISLINGSKSIKESELTVDDMSKLNVLSNKELEIETKVNFLLILYAIYKNEDILNHISDETMANDFMLYYELRRYLEGKIVIDLRIKQTHVSYLEKKILGDVIEMLYNTGFLKNKETQVYDEAVAEAVKFFQKKHDLEPNGMVDDQTYNLLKSDYSNRLKKMELMVLNEFLRELKSYNSYQRGRYDGNLQGTEVGMTLFYTDLMMKVWSFDYQNSSPEDSIMGFKAKANYPLDYSYLEDVIENPATRSWLGPLDSGYEFYDKSELFFSHTATRIFNASSNDLFPGEEEVAANAQSARFSNWWNSHYTEVADYEQEYHRLNQIMKWSVIIIWLREQGKLTFLDGEAVNHNLDFEHWYQDNCSRLKTNVPIPFLDKKQLGENTECIAILNSKPFIGFKNCTNDDSDISSLSGGASLAQSGKVLKKPRICPNSLIFKNRPKIKGIDFSTPWKPENFKLYNDTRFNLDFPKRKLTIQNSIAKYRSKTAELFKLKIDRQVQSLQNQIKIIDSSGNKGIGEFLCKKVGGNIHVSNKEQDLLQLKKYLEGVRKGTGDLGERLGALGDVQFALKSGKNEYLIKVNGSEKYFQIKVANRRNPSMDMVVSSHEKNYLNSNIIDKSDFNAKIENYRWYKTSPNERGEWVTELTNAAPQDARKIYLTKEGITTEAKVAGNSILLENSASKFADNLKFLESLGSGSEKGTIDFICNQLPNENNVFLGLYDKNGKVLFFSKQENINETNRKLFESLLPNSKGTIKGIAFGEENSVRFLSDGVMQIPIEMDPEIKDIFKFVVDKAAESQSWTNIFKQADNITIEDIKMFGKLNQKNYQIGESYYNFKAVKNLPEDYSLVDFRTIGERPQLLVKSGKGNPQVIDVKKSFGKDINEIGGMIKEYYLGNTALTREQIIQETQPIADMLREVMKNTNANVIVTVGPNGVDPAIVAKLHKFPHHVRIYKDQENVKRSVKNAQVNITAELESSMFLSTAPLEHNDYKEISSIYNDIFQTGIAIKSELSFLDFMGILIEPSIQQIVLVIRANTNGIIFTNGVVSFDYLRFILDGFSTDKEMIYVVSNESGKLEEIFANSGKFNCVVTSNYKIGSPFSFKEALKNVKDFYSIFINERAILKQEKYQKIIKENPELAQSVSESIEKEGKTIIIPIGKFTRQQKKSISERLWDVLGKYISGKRGKPYRPKTLKSIINEMQLDLINGLKKVNPQNLIDVLKAIPNLKVQNNKQTKGVAYV